VAGKVVWPVNWWPTLEAASGFCFRMPLINSHPLGKECFA
jgi:hypothetical protein